MLREATRAAKEEAARALAAERIKAKASQGALVKTEEKLRLAQETAASLLTTAADLATAEKNQSLVKDKADSDERLQASRRLLVQTVTLVQNHADLATAASVEQSQVCPR